MRTSTILSILLLAIGLAAGPGIARADSTDANCEVRKEGNKVTRSAAGTTGMSFKWENGKRVDVTWTGNMHSGNSGSRDYGFNQLDNGQLETVFSQPFCSVYFKADGRLDHTSPDCTDDQIERARKAASRGH